VRQERLTGDERCLAVRIPAKLFFRCRAECAKRDISLRALAIEALEKHLADVEGKA
jgi:hypothetical protein